MDVWGESQQLDPGKGIPARGEIQWWGLEFGKRESATLLLDVTRRLKPEGRKLAHSFMRSHTPKQHKFQTEELIHRPEQDIGYMHVCARDGEVNRNYGNADFRCEQLKAFLPWENAMTNLSAWVHTTPSMSTYLSHLSLLYLAVPDSLKA